MQAQWYLRMEPAQEKLGFLLLFNPTTFLPQNHGSRSSHQDTWTSHRHRAPLEPALTLSYLALGPYSPGLPDLFCLPHSSYIPFWGKDKCLSRAQLGGCSQPRAGFGTGHCDPGPPLSLLTSICPTSPPLGEWLAPNKEATINRK
jgi:hypothetical protein